MNSSREINGDEMGCASSPNEHSKETARSIHGWKWCLVCISLYVGGLIYGLDTTIAADIQSAIIEQFDDVEKLTWIGTGFPLGSVVAILPMAAMYANFDLKALFIASILLFEIGSAICGAAPNMDALVVARVIAGFGGTGIFLGTLNYFSLCTNEQERGRYISGIGASWGLGAVLGPVVGGAFSTSSATWRWAFYINLVVALICAPVYLFFLPSLKPPGASDGSGLARLKSMDWAGFLLGTATVASLTLALTFAGSTWSWGDGRTIGTFVASGATFIAMLVQQYFALLTTQDQRMFPPRHILKERTLLLLYIVTAVATANIYVPVYYVPLYFVFTRADSALMAAVRLLPYIVFLVGMNLASGALLSKINYYWVLFLVGGALMTSGAALLSTVDPYTSLGHIYGFGILIGAGAGLTFQLGYTVGGVKTLLQTGSGKSVQHMISVLNLAQLGFQLLSLLIGGQIFQSVAMENLSQALSDLGYSQEELRALITGTQSRVYQSLSMELQAKVIIAITRAISRVYALSIAAGAVALICAILMKKERLFSTKAPLLATVGGV